MLFFEAGWDAGVVWETRLTGGMLVSLVEEFPAWSEVWWVVLAGRGVLGKDLDAGSVDETFFGLGELAVLACDGGGLNRLVCEKKINDNTPTKAVRDTKRMVIAPSRLFICCLTT